MCLNHCSPEGPLVPDLAGNLRLLGYESHLGARPVALWFWLDRSEGQVDARAPVVVLFGHLMLVRIRE